MKRIVSKPLILIAAVVVAVGTGFALWYHHSQTEFRIAGHRMGESLSDFSTIEAKRYRIDLTDCERIGYPGKRELCDYLVRLRDNRDVLGRLTYSSGGWFDDQFPIAENESRLTAPGLPDIAEDWEITFIDGRLSEVEFGPPLKYVNWIRRTYGIPEQYEHPPTQKEKVHGIFVGQTDRESLWTLPSVGRDKALIRLTEAVSDTTVRRWTMYILLCPSAEDCAPAPSLPKSGVRAPSPAPVDGTATAVLPASQQTGPDTAARLKFVIETLQRNDPLPEVPIPDQLWKDIGITPTEEERAAKANALRLSNGEVPELLVEDTNPDVCGSSGCATFLYGIRSGRYGILLDGDVRGSLRDMKETTNGYKDLLLGSRYGVIVYKFNGAKYQPADCLFREDDERPDYWNPPYKLHPEPCKK